MIKKTPIKKSQCPYCGNMVELFDLNGFISEYYCEVCERWIDNDD